MVIENADPEQHGPAAGALVEQAASYLRELLVELTSRLRPFPAFLNMVSLQAMELDPLPGAPLERGCVVVLPGGEICELDLKVLPGIEGIRDIDSVEEINELELQPDEYNVYASAAIQLVLRELRRRAE